MKELAKVERYGFSEIYEGVVGDSKIVCILDDNCVRWSLCRKARTIYKQVSRHEFSNDKKELCFKNATRALNRL